MLATSIYEKFGYIRRLGIRRNFHIYYCGGCFEPLLLSCKLPKGSMLNLLEGARCPRCWAELRESACHRLMEDDLDVGFWCNDALPLIHREDRQAILPRPVFKPASALYGLTSGHKLVDALIGGLRQPTMVFLYGLDLVLEISERYCFRAQLPENRGGFGSPAIFLDAGNSFNVYQLSAIAREYDFDIRKALNSVIITRAFTVYQLHHLVNGLPTLMHTYGARLAVVSNILELFDELSSAGESRKICYGIISSLEKLSRQNFFVIVTSWKDDANSDLVRNKADIAVKFILSHNTFEGYLTKHPHKPFLKASQKIVPEIPRDQLQLTRVV